MAVNRPFGRDVGERIRFTSEYVNARILLSNVEEKETIPQGYNLVVINATAPLYVKLGDSSVSATVPSGDVSNGSASELSPTSYSLQSEQTTISLISPSNCVATLAYYWMDK